MYKALLAVIIGGTIGCTIRCLLSIRLNGFFPQLPLGTLLVNLFGGFLIGMALAFFEQQKEINPIWQIFITTGLCGGMTTFSTFSAEIVLLLQAGNYLWAVLSVFIHVLGALLMTIAGFFIMRILL